MVCCSYWCIWMQDKYSWGHINIADKLWQIVFFKARFYFQKLSPFPHVLHSGPVILPSGSGVLPLPLHLGRLRTTLAERVWQSHIARILRVSHQNQWASACFSWNIHSEGRQPLSGKSNCPEMAMLERSQGGTRVTTQRRLPSHSCPCASLWEKPSQVFQTRRSISWVSMSVTSVMLRGAKLSPGPGKISGQNLWASKIIVILQW